MALAMYNNHILSTMYFSSIAYTLVLIEYVKKLYLLPSWNHGFFFNCDKRHLTKFCTNLAELLEFRLEKKNLHKISQFFVKKTTKNNFFYEKLCGTQKFYVVLGK
jgi:hypothetical protein